jgi:hypothetical protein
VADAVPRHARTGEKRAEQRNTRQQHEHKFRYLHGESDLSFGSDVDHVVYGRQDDF